MKKRVLAIVFLMVSLFVISGCTQRLVYESMQKVDDGVTGETFANVVDDSVWIFHSDIKLNPDIYLCLGGRIVDFEGLGDINQLNMLMDSELSLRQGNEEIIVIGAKNDL